jgi:hypothetical protein
MMNTNCLRIFSFTSSFLVNWLTVLFYFYFFSMSVNCVIV